ncbi:MAG: hypothetical protein ACI9J2_000645 [Saprospiraceae bacterium]|jgi:hypothetical protein
MLQRLTLLIVTMLFVSVSYAHKQVVVVPLGADPIPVYEGGKTGPAGGIVK